MSSDVFTFSIPDHTLRLDGYLDAVGRSLSTETELFALSAQRVDDEAHLKRVLGVPAEKRTLVINWSEEFGSLVEALGMDQRARLGFYLIDTICWLEEFTSGAKCFKLECAQLRPDATEQSAYLFEFEDSLRVLLLAVRSTKMHNNSLKSSAAKPRTLG